MTGFFLPKAIGEPKGVKSTRVKQILMKMRQTDPETGVKVTAGSSVKVSGSSAEVTATRGKYQGKGKGARGRKPKNAKNNVESRPKVKSMMRVVELSESSSDNSDDTGETTVKVKGQSAARSVVQRGKASPAKRPRRK